MMSLAPKGLVSCAAAAGLSLPWAQSVYGQDSPVDVSAAIECYAVKTLDRDAACPPGVRSAILYLVPGKYPPVTVEAVMRGLVDLALESDDLVVRSAAVTGIAMVGRDKWDVGIPTVPYLERLYREARHLDVKATAVREAGLQADKQAAAEFLERVAVAEVEGDQYEVSIPESAILGLARLGKPGKAALDRLASESSVSDSQARARLQRMYADTSRN